MRFECCKCEKLVHQDDVILVFKEYVGGLAPYCDDCYNERL